MIFVDDRTDGERVTHTFAVIGTDRVLSGWGLAIGGASFAGWACTPAQIDTVEQRIRSRGDMQRVRVVLLKDYRPKGIGHCHIYCSD